MAAGKRLAGVSDANPMGEPEAIGLKCVGETTANAEDTYGHQGLMKHVSPILCVR